MFSNVLNITVYILMAYIKCPLVIMLEGTDVDEYPGTQEGVNLLLSTQKN